MSIYGIKIDTDLIDCAIEQWSKQVAVDMWVKRELTEHETEYKC